MPDQLIGNPRPAVVDRSCGVTAQVTVPEAGARGTIAAQGGAFGGWALYLHDGRLVYCYNLLGRWRFKTTAERPLVPGTHKVRAELTSDGGGPGEGGDVALFVDGRAVGHGRVQATHPFLFSLDQAIEVGREAGTAVGDDYPAVDSAFTGSIGWVELDAGPGHLDDHAGPPHVLAVALAAR